MTYRRLELRVGFTIFLAILVLTVGLMWFQGFKIGRTTWDLHAVFPMVGGIDPGDVVNVNGVERGEVKRVELRDRDVLVTMKLRDVDGIPDDSRVVLQTVGIMGERVVSIILGESDVHVEPGAVLQGVYDPGISEALAHMGILLEDLTLLARDIHEITGVLTKGERLDSTIANLAAITGELRRTLDVNAPEFERGIASFRRSSERMEDFVERNAERMDSIVVSIDEMSGDLPALVDRMNELTAALAGIAARLEDDESTLGSLIHDRELMDRLEEALAGFDELVTDIKANPKRYFKVEIF
ncbi:MAG: MCE family protein [Candidatus Krumholzibacteriota bacterium]|nr:MCE family protein [Candidatus Krumholzibacteriota bacterium]